MFISESSWASCIGGVYFGPQRCVLMLLVVRHGISHKNLKDWQKNKLSVSRIKIARKMPIVVCNAPSFCAFLVILLYVHVFPILIRSPKIMKNLVEKLHVHLLVHQFEATRGGSSRGALTEEEKKSLSARGGERETSKEKQTDAIRKMEGVDVFLVASLILCHLRLTSCSWFGRFYHCGGCRSDFVDEFNPVLLEIMNSLTQGIRTGMWG